MDMILNIAQIVVGFIVVWVGVKMLKEIFMGKKIIETDPDDGEEARIAAYPKIKIETVEYKGEKIYLLNEFKGKFLGQTMSLTDMKALIAQRYPNQNIIVVSDDETSGTILSTN